MEPPQRNAPPPALGSNPAPDSAARALKRAQQAVYEFENTLPPIDFLKQIAIETAAGRRLVAEALQESRTACDLKACEVLQPYTAQVISGAATLYVGVGPRADRRLLVAFCGKRSRPMMPVPLVLQQLDVAHWDMLLLRDPTNSHFRNGIRGMATTLPELRKWLAARAPDYAGLVVFGTSMGGFPAVRLALGLGDVRAVSVSGRPFTDAATLMARQRPLHAFDPICACLTPRPRDLIFVGAAGHAKDREAAGYAAALTGGMLCPIAGSRDHNLLWTLYEAGRLRAFLDIVLDPDRTPATVAKELAHLLPPKPPAAKRSLPRRAVAKLMRVARRVFSTLRSRGAP